VVERRSGDEEPEDEEALAAAIGPIEISSAFI